MQAPRPDLPDEGSVIPESHRSEHGGGSAKVDALPLAFPRSRWLSFDVEDRARFNRAQLLLDALPGDSLRGVSALERDTGLSREQLGEALALLDDLGLVELEDRDDGLVVSLVATPEEHIGVTFPDGRVHWVFVSRPVVEPEVGPEELN